MIKLKKLSIKNMTLTTEDVKKMIDDGIDFDIQQCTIKETENVRYSDIFERLNLG